MSAKRRKKEGQTVLGVNRRRFIAVTGGTVLGFGAGLVPLSSQAINWSGLWSGIKRIFNCGSCKTGFCFCFGNGSGGSGNGWGRGGSGSWGSGRGAQSGSGHGRKSGLPIPISICWCKGF